MILQLALEHMGKLHPVENAIVLVLAFGPVLLLAVSISIARKRNLEDEPEPSDRSDSVDGPDPS